MIEVASYSSPMSHHSNLSLLLDFFKEVEVCYGVFRILVLVVGLELYEGKPNSNGMTTLVS